MPYYYLDAMRPGADAETEGTMKGYSAQRYEILAVSKPAEDADLRHSKLLGYRTKVTQAGELIYIAAYPIAKDRDHLKEARKKLKQSRESQMRLNHRNATQKIEQYINHNFAPGDTFVTHTYDESCMPDEFDDVRRDVRNYIKRLRTRAGYAGNALKYLYVIELSEARDPEAPNAPPPRWHVHMVISGVDRDTIEDQWPYGNTNARHLRDSKEKFAGIANYMLKRRSSWRTWEKSRNLLKPPAKWSDRALSRRRVERIARDVRHSGKEIFEAVYPGYELIDSEVRVSDYVPGAYIYARMRKLRTLDRPGAYERRARDAIERKRARGMGGTI